MAKKSKLIKKRKKPVKKGLRGFFLFLFVALLAVAAGGLLWLDHLVQQRFDSHQWELPARVYASPVELYQGRALSMAHLKQLLDYMHYRAVAGAPSPGTYAQAGSTVTLYTRGFRDSDGGEIAQKIRLRLADNQVVELVGVDRPVSVARLEPLHIGSIHPGHEQDRVLVRLEQTPELLVQMLIATEDRQFYQHHGISFRGLARAMAANVRSGGFRQGGSTITQQLVKNFWLSRDRTLSRKLLEIPMAVLLEQHYDKHQILETYLNEVYLGQDGGRAIHGMGLAALFYFGQPLEELEPQHLALLVGMLKGPGLYNPRRHPERALERRNVVLNVAEELGILSSEAAEEARGASLEVVAQGDSTLYAFPDFIDLVRRQLARDYPAEVLSSEGLVIHSTLDVLAQLAAEDAVVSVLSQKDPDGKQSLEASVVLTAPDQGDVLALVGSRTPRYVGFNRALDAKRPIGSLVKPMVLLTALKQPKKYHLASLIEDEPITVKLPQGKTWSPKNVDNKSLGPITLADMLAKSRNQATVRLGMELGTDAVIATLYELGLRQTIGGNPSLLLGSLDLTPFSVASLYQPLATGGFQTALRSITDVLDHQGEPIARYPVQPQMIMDSDTVFLVQWAMQKVITEGTGRSALARLPANLQVAGKTGTSGDYRDAWFAGFSGNHLAVVWIGRDDNKPAGVSGSSTALPIWADLMAALPQRSLRNDPPSTLKQVWWDAEQQLLYSEACKNTEPYPVLTPTIEVVEFSQCRLFDRVDNTDIETSEKRGVRGWFRKRFGK